LEFLAYLIKRVLWSFVVLAGLSVVIFTVARAVPGDPARMALGPRASQEQVAQLQERMGLDRPLVEQYGLFVTGLVQGDLGLSLLTERPVADDIRDTFMATFELVAVTILIAFALGVPLGVAAAHWKDRWPDNLVRMFALFSAVAPAFFLALLLQILAGYVWQVLPTNGRLPASIDFVPDLTGMLTIDSILAGRFDVLAAALRHLLLPAIALASTTLGQIALTTRAAMIDTSTQDYIEASRAFGVPERVQVFKYMLRPSFVPPLTIMGLAFASLIGAAFVVELVFSWPGMASYGIRAILQKDLNAVMGVVMVSGVFFVFINLTIDVLMGFVDPRIRIRGGF
jgi:peptide/nickel transport system permease protein